MLYRRQRSVFLIKHMSLCRICLQHRNRHHQNQIETAIIFYHVSKLDTCFDETVYFSGDDYTHFVKITKIMNLSSSLPRGMAVIESMDKPNYIA